jgi:hypothetical protein
LGKTNTRDQKSTDDVIEQMPLMKELTYIKYLDHVLFRNVNPDAYGPFVRETVGWVVQEGKDYIKLIWERSTDRLGKESRQAATGLVILKSAIIELKRLSVSWEIKDRRRYI